MSSTSDSAQISVLQAKLAGVAEEVGIVIVGQNYLIDRLLIGLLVRGHVLVEGLPGLAKTLTISTLSDSLAMSFSRIQFTPDLLPGDITGTLIYNQGSGEFVTSKGPVFANLILADEINRAPAKVQAALLEAMQERQVTIGTRTYALDEPFLVMATQNPIEQEGTYPLPEAQLDRFLFKLKVIYPTRQQERGILDRMAGADIPKASAVLSPQELLDMRLLVENLYMDDKLKEYILDLVFATRDPKAAGLARIAPFIEYGSSPRATLALARAAKGHAFLRGRAFATPDDVKAVGADILRHRIVLTYEALAERVGADEIVTEIFQSIEVP